jgi:hypothetical protein
MITVSSAHAEENVDEHHVPGCMSNSLHRLQAGCGWGFAIALILAIVTPSSSMPAEIAQMSMLPNPAVEVVVRPCKSGSVGSKRAKGANNRSQKPGDESGDTTAFVSRCIPRPSKFKNICKPTGDKKRLTEKKW